MKNVTFVHSPNRFFSEVQNNGIIFMPVWAYTLASHLPDDGGYNLVLQDARMNTIEHVPPADIFLMSGINQDYKDLVESRDALKARFPDVPIVLGGPICWSFDTAGDIGKLSMFDHIFIGDGEDAIHPLIERILAGEAVEKVIRNHERFELGAARPFHRGLMDNTIRSYYGAVLEVSRGCPFLCEFCDIRILPDNNRAHLKDPTLIVEEVDHICRQGVTSFLLACDNFIGDGPWAEEVLDKLIEWRQRSKYRPVFYTWLTINLHKIPELMKKMRRAGFDVLFIGVESFDSNSLLETAKVQNIATGVVEAVQEIQSYGFPIVAGLIFGFDSDDEECFDRTLEGLLESGLLSGDPSLLTALPGTPLYRRMELAGRLRKNSYGLGGHKYHTNIRYLMPHDELIRGYIRFSRKLCRGEFQYARLRAFFSNLRRGNHVRLDTASYFSFSQGVKVMFRNRGALRLLGQRVTTFAMSPRNVWYLLKGLLLTTSARGIGGRFGYFKFWVAVWSTIIVKYRDLKPLDFDIESVREEIMRSHVIPPGYEDVDGTEPIPAGKTRAQRRETLRSLERLVQVKAFGRPPKCPPKPSARWSAPRMLHDG